MPVYGALKTYLIIHSLIIATMKAKINDDG